MKLDGLNSILESSAKANNLQGVLSKGKKLSRKFNQIEQVSYNYKKKNGDAPGPLGDFVKSLVTQRLLVFAYY